MRGSIQQTIDFLDIGRSDDDPVLGDEILGPIGQILFDIALTFRHGLWIINQYFIPIRVPQRIDQWTRHDLNSKNLTDCAFSLRSIEVLYLGWLVSEGRIS